MNMKTLIKHLISGVCSFITLFIIIFALTWDRGTIETIQSSTIYSKIFFTFSFISLDIMFYIIIDEIADKLKNSNKI